MEFRPPKDLSFRWQVQADLWMAGVEETHQMLWENIIKAQQRQTKYASGNEMTLAVGDKVWPSTRNLKTSRHSKKLDYNCTGPYKVSRIPNRNSYKLDLPSTMWGHNVLHVLLLHRYTPPVRAQPSSELHPMIVKETWEWEVDHILESKRHYRKLHYHVQLAGYNHICTSWEPEEPLKNTRDLVEAFQWERLDRPPE